VASPYARTWTERERSIFLSVGHSLKLAFERTEQSQLLASQNAELEARTRALEEFANLTRELAMEIDQYPLVYRAQELVLSLLPEGYAAYYEPEASLWRLKSQVGEFRNDALQRFVDAGFPYESPTMLTPWTTRQPVYQDVYAQRADIPVEVMENVQASRRCRFWSVVPRSGCSSSACSSGAPGAPVTGRCWKQ